MKHKTAILKNKAFIATLVAMITFLVFLPTLQNEFIGDDFGYVVENTFIRSIDLNLFKSAFLSFQIANWHPLTWISHAMDYAIWGVNPLGHHLTNNIFHTANTFILVLLLVSLIEVGRGTTRPFSMHGRVSLQEMPHDLRFTLIAAATTGLLFGLHPLRVEAVAWVAERKELLCDLFFLLSIVMYTKYVAGLSNITVKLVHQFLNKQYLFTVGLFVLALLSKPMAVTLPFVLLILDWYPFQRIYSLRTFLCMLGEKVPFIALSIVASILTIMAQEEGATIVSTAVIPLSTRALVAAKCPFAYLWKMMLPLNLKRGGYLYPNPKDVTMFSSEYLLWIFLLTGITMTVVFIAKKQQLWLSVWMYYFVTLVPVLGIVKAGGIFMADRYSYLPSLGPSLVVGLLMARIQEKISAMKRRRLLFEIGGVTAGIAILICLSLITIKQIRLWKNDPELKANLNRIRLAEAMELFQKAQVYFNLGIGFEKKGLPDKAIKEYQTALTIYPNYADARLSLGNAYLKSGLSDKAIEQFQILVELQPAEAFYRNALGFAYVQRGFTDRAIEQFKAAVQLTPSNLYYQKNLNMAYGLKDPFSNRTPKDRPGR